MPFLSPYSGSTSLQALLEQYRPQYPLLSPQTDRTLYYAGALALLEKPIVAIVGSRHVSREGQLRARRLAQELVASGVVVMSGLARGVDTAALTEALTQGGSVIGVIGTPLAKTYPPENRLLQALIAQQHLLITPFRPAAPIFQSNFPLRNRVMAALSDSTVIIEATDTSGSLHQARECVRLQRPLFIAQSILSSSLVTWPQWFLGKESVHLLTNTDDVLRVLKNSRREVSGSDRPESSTAA